MPSINPSNPLSPKTGSPTMDEHPDINRLNLASPSSDGLPPASACTEPTLSAETQKTPSQVSNDNDDDHESASDEEIVFDSDEGGEAFDDSDLEYDSDGNIDVQALEKAGHYVKKEKPAIALLGTSLQQFVTTLPSIPVQSIDQAEQTCAICTMKYEEGDEPEVAVRLPCGHIFGRGCLHIWFGAKDKGGWGYTTCRWCKKDVVIPGK